MSSRKSIVNALYLIMQPLLLNVFSIPATAYIIRGLGPLGYGQWATAVSIVAVLGFLTSLGLRPQFVRDVARDLDNASETLAYQLGLRCMLTFTATVLAFVVSLLFHHDPIVKKCVLITASGLFLITITSTFTDLLQGMQQIRLYATVNLVSGCVVTVCTVLAVYAGADAVGLSCAYLIGPLTSAGLLYAIIRKLNVPIYLRWNIYRFRSILGDSSMWTASMFLNSVRDRVEQLMVPKIAGLTAMGYFTAGSMLTDRLQIIPDGLSGAFYPTIVSEVNNEKHNGNYTIQRLLTLSVSVCFAFTILLSGLAEPISQILFPKSALFCEFVVRITSYALPFIGLVYPLGLCLVAVGKQSEAARYGMYATLVSVCLSAVLVMGDGLRGACWSYVGRYAIPVLFLLPLFNRAFPQVLPKMPAVRILMSASIMAILLQVAVATVKLSPMSVLYPASALAIYASCGLLALLTYLIVLVALGVVDKAEICSWLSRRIGMASE